MTVLQHATNAHLRMVARSKMFHQNYCAFHGYTYELTTERLQEGNPIFDKVVVILRWLKRAKEGDIAIWLDADSLWRRGRFPLVTAFNPQSMLAMVQMHIGYFNTGVIFIRACPTMLAFFEQVMTGADPRTRKEISLAGIGIIGPRWQDQAFVNYELCDGFSHVECQELDSRFNSFKFQKSKPTGEIIVQSWHAESLSCQIDKMKIETAMLPILALPA